MDTTFYPEKNLALLQEMLTCGAPVYLWTYAPDGHLIQTNCPALVMDAIFTTIGCKAYMLEYGKANTAPLMLGAPLGLMWCAAFDRQDDELRKMYVIGPVLNTETSTRGLNDAMNEYDIPLEFKPRFRELMKELPIVGTPLFFQYGLMLHYCVTGEKLERSDIQFQEGEIRGSGKKKKLEPKDRHRTYGAEQALMWMIREGNLDYQSALDRAGGLSNGVRISSDRPMEQAVISCAVFTSLCVRASIEGGLAPENAYVLGDSYIQSLIQCKTITELTAVNHEMYVDFVRRVHKFHTNPNLSSQVQACCDYIELHLEEPISLQQLAVLAGYRDYYLSRKFKKETGFNVNDYIKFARVEKAKMLLTATTDPIQDIARQLQFCSSSYFSETFQEITGLTPHQWRKQAGRSRTVPHAADTTGHRPH